MTCARIGFVDNAKTVLRIQAGAQGGWEGTHKLGTQTEAKFRHGLEFCASVCCFVVVCFKSRLFGRK